ncbi:MAG: hypothetical protein AAFU77_06790 [Myxococcota bacterium]
MSIALVLIVSLFASDSEAAKRKRKKQKQQPPSTEVEEPLLRDEKTGKEFTVESLIEEKLESRPWADSVDREEQLQAARFFYEGNKLLRESVFVRAAEQYRKALELWDHPGIHYNMVLALLNLDQPLEVNSHLDSALAYGAAPLDNDKYQQALQYKELISVQLATIRVRCDEPGTLVRLDGRKLFVGPGEATEVVRVGPHTLVATKDGYLTNEVSETLEPRANRALELRMIRPEDLTRYERRFSESLPWTVIGIGAGLAAAGAASHYFAADRYDTFDRGIEACNGCVPDESLENARSTGDILRATTYAAYGLAGASLITGAVLLYMNQPTKVRLDPEDLNTSVTISAAPSPGGGVNVAARLEF